LVCKDEKADGIPSFGHREMANRRFIQHDHASQERIRFSYDVGSVLPVFLQQYPELFCVGLIFERNLNIADGRGSGFARSRLGARDNRVLRSV